jgi:hypothetical protein
MITGLINPRNPEKAFRELRYFHQSYGYFEDFKPWGKEPGLYSGIWLSMGIMGCEA